MSKLMEAANKASELYDDFVNEFDLADAYTLGYLDWLATEQEMSEEYDNEGYGPVTHWDEQAYSNYMYETDEDGEWLHPYDKEY